MSIYDAEISTLEGEKASLADYEGKALLLVNVASKCGLTPQYEGLEKLHEQYAGRGFEVLGFPCNQFGGQEPGTAEEIREFCDTNYHVAFPLFEKVDVNGAARPPDLPGAHPGGRRRRRGGRREVELREVPGVAGRQGRGAVPPAGQPRGPLADRGDRGESPRLIAPPLAFWRRYGYLYGSVPTPKPKGERLCREWTGGVGRLEDS